MASCDYYIELLSAGLDGQLTAEQEQELAQHLLECPACRELGPRLVAAHAAFSALEEVPAPEGFTEGVMERVRGQENRQKVVPLFKRPAWKAVAGLAACCVLCFGAYQSGLLGGQTGLGSAMEYEDAGQFAAIQEQVMTIEATEGGAPVMDSASVDGQSAGTYSRAPQNGSAAQEPAVAAELERLPQNSVSVLGEDIQWETDEAGRIFCVVSSAQLLDLLQLAEQEGMRLPEISMDGVAPESVCRLYVTE